MASPVLVGSVSEFPEEPTHDVPENSRPHYTAIRGVRPLPPESGGAPQSVKDNRPQSTRLIYFDQRRATELLEHIASTSPGFNMLRNLAEVDSTNVLGTPNQRAILHQIIHGAKDLEVGVIDLHQPDDSNRQTSWTQLHPDQVVAIRGTVASGKDVQPSSIRLEVGAASVRVFVERDHFLHLNQKYLTRLPITIIGKVRSVPRIELCAVAIGIQSA